MNVFMSFPKDTYIKRWIANYIYVTICVMCIHILWLCRYCLVYVCKHCKIHCESDTYMTCYETYCFQLPGNGNLFSIRKILIKLEEKHYMHYTLFTRSIEK